MAAIGNIRKHGVALIVIVGLAMFAFIIGDFLSSGTSYFNRRREYVGEIEGQKIHYTEYEAAKERLTEVYKIETGRNDFDEDLSANIRNQVWQMYLTDYTLQSEGKKIGMTVTKDELADLCFGEHVDQIISSRRAFMDENGQFSRQNLVQFLASLENEPENAEQQAYINQAKTYWLYWENVVRINRMQQKYNALLQNCITANSLDAKYAFDAAQTSVNIEYVTKPYFAVADSLVTVSNSEIKSLYNKHKEQYRQEPNRSIIYVSFPVVPSEQDFADTEALLKKLQNEFYTTDDVMTVVNINSDITYNARDLSESEVPEQYREFAFGKDAKEGNVTEISFADNTYSMARLMKAGYSLPDSVELKAIADPKQEGAEDQELGWVPASQLPKELAEQALKAKKGERITVTLGMQEQTFEVLDIAKPTPKVRIAILAREVSASSKTYAQIYNSAKQFIVANPDEESFRNGAKEADKDIKNAAALQKNTDKVQDLKSSRPIVRWVFEAKEGDVSDVFECGDQFIVACVTDIQDGNYRPLEAVSSELRYEALNKKKADKLKKDLAGIATLEDAAGKLDAEIQTAEDVTLASYRFGSAGMEPAVIGEALRLESGKLAVVEGVAGIYVIKGGEKRTADGEFNKESQIQQLNMRTSYSVPYQAISLIEKNAKVTDNRANFQ